MALLLIHPAIGGVVASVTSEECPSDQMHTSSSSAAQEALVRYHTHYMCSTLSTCDGPFVLDQGAQIRTLSHAGACPVKADTNSDNGEQSERASPSNCPVNPRNVMPVQPSDVTGTDVDARLSTARAPSTIPVAEPESLPDHQKVTQDQAGNSNWLYPSEKMFYDAMKRKVRSFILEASATDFHGLKPCIYPCECAV